MRKTPSVHDREKQTWQKPKPIANSFLNRCSILSQFPFIFTVTVRVWYMGPLDTADWWPFAYILSDTQPAVRAC